MRLLDALRQKTLFTFMWKPRKLSEAVVVALTLYRRILDYTDIMGDPRLPRATLVHRGSRHVPGLAHADRREF